MQSQGIWVISWLLYVLGFQVMDCLLIISQMKAVKRFKQLLVRKRPELMEGIFGRASRFVQPPLSMNPMNRTKSDNTDNRKHTEQALTVEGVHRDIPISDDLERLPEGVDAEVQQSKEPSQFDKIKSHANHAEVPKTSRLETGRGQAHDPLEDTLLLGIGAGGDEIPLDPGEFSAVSESPGAVEGNIYEMAYQEELDRILARQESRKPTIYLTRRVEHNKTLRALNHVTDMPRISSGLSSSFGLRKLVEDAKARVDDAKTKSDSVKESATSSKAHDEP
jgi:[calcium/calmodulin-dependent protein kinase] kinase